mmetsp:Transcript_4320/g.6696  ORF Transcript_4320/g.6696 Transcript_4320/m.6696 type:complete len:292 (+) Transcript_4320:87-962(+)
MEDAKLGDMPDDGDMVRSWIHKLEAPPKPSESVLDEKAMELKAIGNKAFRAGPEKYDEALEKYSDAIKICETNPKLKSTLHSNRALLYLHKKEYNLAYADTKIAVENDPGNGKAYVRAGQACEKIGKMKMAMAWLNLALDRADTRKAKSHAATLLKKMVEEEALRQQSVAGKTKIPISQAQMQGMGSTTALGSDGKPVQKLMSTEELKERKAKFDTIVKRYNLNALEPQNAIADYLTGLNGKVATAEDFIKRFPMMSVQEAVDFLSWIQTGIQFKEQVLDKNRKAAGLPAL